MLVSVIIPSTGRAEQLVACVEQLLKVSPSVEAVCIIEHDPESARLLREREFPIKVIEREELSGAVKCWNDGAIAASGDAFVLGADDMWFHEKWLGEALKALDVIGGDGLVGLNTLKPNRKNFDDTYLVTKKYCQSAFGGVFIVPHYRHYCLDREACLHAQRDGKYIYAERSIVEHRHYTFGKARRDAIYDIDANYRAIDNNIFVSRQAREWPRDYDPIF